MAEHSVLIVDHEKSVRDHATRILSADGYKVHASSSSQEAIDLARRVRPDLLVINPTMPALSGVEAATRISQSTKCKVLFLSEMARDADFREMLRGLKQQGCECSAIKVPFEQGDLLAHVRREIGSVLILTDQEESVAPKPSVAPMAAAPAPARVPVSEYQPLLEMAAPQLYENNAFRVTGLAVDASLRDISRSAERLEMIAKGFGVAESTSRPFSSTAPSVEEIKTALQCLKTPEQRLLHEFFWFWPTGGQSQPDPPLAAINAGEITKAKELWSAFAVRQQELTAVSARLDSQCPDVERRTLLQRKKELERAAAVSVHNLAVLDHIRALSPAAKTSTLTANASDQFAAWQSSFNYWRKLRNQHVFWEVLVDRVRSINDPRLGIEVAEMIWTSLPMALLLINAEFAVTAAEARNFEEAGVHRRLMKESGFGDGYVRDALCRKLKPLQAELARLCHTAEEHAHQGPENGADIVRKFFEDKKKYLQTFNYLLGSGDALRDSVHDLVAGSARSSLVAYVNKTEDWEAAQPLFEECLALAASKSLRSRLEDDLEMLAGNAAAKKAARRAQATAAPPVQRPSGAQASTTTSAQTKSPWRAIAAIAVVGIVILIATIQHNSGSSGTPPSQSSPTTSTAVPTPQPTAPTYSEVQSDDSTETASLKATIERNRARLSQMENSVSDLKNRMATLQSEIDADEATLDEMKRNHDLGYEVNVSSYENLRQGHNSAIDTYNALVREHNAALREYKSLLSTTNNEIDRYNALARSQ
jgi:CheY-like chemotaxis protein